MNTTTCRRSSSNSQSNLAVEDILAREIPFIHHVNFQDLSEKDLEADCPSEIFDWSTAKSGLSENGNMEPAVTDSSLLTPQGEQYLFRRMNYYRYRANCVRASISSKRPSMKKVHEFKRLVASAEEARSQIVEANLRLVCAIAHKMSNSSQDFDEYVSEGNLILVNAVDKFDFSRGFRFSTYATHAVQRHLYRVMQRRQRRRSREFASPDEILRDQVPTRDQDAPLDERIAQQLIDRFDDCLDQRERTIIEERFGLNGRGSSAETLKAVADKVGLSKERVRQLQIRAIEKLQDLAIQMNLRLESTL